MARLADQATLAEGEHMGSELHITRAEEWWDSEKSPLPRAEWHAFARTRPDLVEDGWVQWAHIGQEPVFFLQAGNEPSLTWLDGQVTVTGADVDDINPLAAIAEALGAKMFDDDGEEYAAFEPPVSG
jgi:hypothetical protein